MLFKGSIFGLYSKHMHRFNKQRHNIHIYISMPYYTTLSCIKWFLYIGLFGYVYKFSSILLLRKTSKITNRKETFKYKNIIQFNNLSCMNYISITYGILNIYGINISSDINIYALPKRKCKTDIISNCYH